MNLPELIIFPLVTGTAGAGVGALVGLFTGGIAPAAKLGALLGPIVGAVALTLWAASVRLKNRSKNNEDRTSGDTERR